jgi:predicted subunit of tRNA(5-methylaminomethyl-2-thiouridylate) methyltransferase
MNNARTIGEANRMDIATSELKGRIRRIHLEESLTELACDLCLEQVPVETAIQKIQDKALEKMVPLLDTKILADPAAMQTCLELVAEESQRVALKALQRGTELLEEGLSILEDGEWELPQGGYIN